MLRPTGWCPHQTEEVKMMMVHFISVCDLLDALFEGERVEVVTKGGLSPYIGSHILNDAIYV